MSKAASYRDFDWLLLLLALGIAAIGVVEIYSTTAHTALAAQYKRQIYWILMGCILAIAVSRFDYHQVLEQIPWIYLVSILALLAVLVGGHSASGARRWLKIGPLTFQVSELAKLVIIVAVAAYLASRREKSVSWSDLVVLGALVGVPATLIAIEPDLGTSLTLVPIVAAGLFLAGIRVRQVLALLLLGVLILPVGWHFLKPYQRERVETFIHPGGHPGFRLSILASQDCDWIGRLLGQGYRKRNAEPAGIHSRFPRRLHFRVFRGRTGLRGYIARFPALFCLAVAPPGWSSDSGRPRGHAGARRFCIPFVFSSCRECRDDDRLPAGHRNPFATDESRRILDPHHFPGSRLGHECQDAAFRELTGV